LPLLTTLPLENVFRFHLLMVNRRKTLHTLTEDSFES
jgi:hypothetical protein